MMNRLFGKPKPETNALQTLDKLNETLEMLEKKEKVLLKKAGQEVEKAKEYTRAKNKRAAIQCLKRKRLYEQQVEQLGNFQLRIHDQMIMLEGAKATTETVDALRSGASAMKAMQKATNIDDVDKTMDEINEQTENMKQIQEALSTPIGAAADFDEDELEAELEELEGAELEEQLLQPTTVLPSVPAGRQQARYFTIRGRPVCIDKHEQAMYIWISMSKFKTLSGRTYNNNCRQGEGKKARPKYLEASSTIFISNIFPERGEKGVSRVSDFIHHHEQRIVMSKKRGLSLEEKREKMLQIFYDSQDFFLLKELEKMGPKKGVISQSVKDVIQSLVDDDLVAKDKIGISVYFWSLPSCAGNQLRSVRQKLESDLQGSNKKLAELVDQCDALKKGREESEERTEALAHLQDIEKKHKELKNEMVQFADNDPATLEAMRAAIEVAHQSANRWTDNIFTLRQWCSNNFPQAKEQLEHLYTEAGITEDFDYLELSSFPLSSSSHDPETPKQLLVEDQA
ncbi:hypothetical protein IGI04_013391 [Brassica rapa subsp. trilocularis]|nr:hypothetical protein IGI04_013388 [Brassica rapa subsp. trilocularis]KAG5407272.1 hypothetical protein IGI04_013391 [Brassica rapa subsp. trilocularis]